MNQQQAIALAQGLIKILGAALAAHGSTKAANIINGEDVSGVVIALAGVLWSHFYHGDAPTLARAQVTVAKDIAGSSTDSKIVGIITEAPTPAAKPPTP